MKTIKMLDTVALLEDLPEHGLRQGEVGTVVEMFAATPARPGAYLVEFSDRNGVTYAMPALAAEKVMPLYHREAA